MNINTIYDIQINSLHNISQLLLKVTYMYKQISTFITNI